MAKRRQPDNEFTASVLSPEMETLVRGVHDINVGDNKKSLLPSIVQLKTTLIDVRGGASAVLGRGNQPSELIAFGKNSSVVYDQFDATVIHCGPAVVVSATPQQSFVSTLDASTAGLTGNHHDNDPNNITDKKFISDAIKITNDDKAVNESEECCQCMERKKICIATPCMHLCLCAACCRDSIMKECPRCRQKVAQWMPFFA